MQLYSHQQKALDETKEFNRVAYYHDMGLGKTFTGSEKLKEIKCPLCSSSKHVGEILTTKSTTNNNVTSRNFCGNCLVEFDKNGVLYPPIY